MLTKPTAEFIDDHGSIFDSTCRYLVNPTNSVGIMGAGLAKQFMARWPYICKSYNILSQARNPTKPYSLLPPRLYPLPHSNQSVIMFPTKRHWRDKADLADIIINLDILSENLSKLTSYTNPEANTMALPKIGCGLGGLDFSIVRPYIENVLERHGLWRFHIHV